MALKPHYMLRGVIRIVKEVKGKGDMTGMVERHYVDENGDKAIVSMKDLKGVYTTLKQRLTCMCCMDVASKKKLLDIWMNYRDGSTVTVVHSCPICGKQTRSVYNLFSQGPLNVKDGYQFKEYGKKGQLTI